MGEEFLLVFLLWVFWDVRFGSETMPKDVFRQKHPERYNSCKMVLRTSLLGLRAALRVSETAVQTRTRAKAALSERPRPARTAAGSRRRRQGIFGWGFGFGLASTLS